MDPVYNCIHSYPYQRDRMHYSPHNYPTNVVPTQLFVNPTRPPINYSYCPWSSNYGYPTPVSGHGCCNHNNHFPPHYYSHVPPFHYPGNCPIPTQYMPPPSYAMQQPQYEYEKNMPKNHHCCGCPNHSYHQNEQKNIKKVEEGPDVETRKSDSMVPFQLKNYPYPIVWLPPDYNSAKEHEKINKSEYEEGKDGFIGAKPLENRKNPYDMHNSGSPNQRGDGCFPFPIVWMPYEPEEKEKKALKVNDASQKQSLESPKGSDVDQNVNVNGEHTGGRASSRSKDILVKEMEQREEKEKDKDAPARDGNDDGVQKSPEDGSKKKSVSPPKSSNLPPVCLRVDPLPRRKSANGSSRSPSPPAEKRKLDQPSNEANKVLPSSDNQKLSEITKIEAKEAKGITKSIEVRDGITNQGDLSKNKIEEKPIVEHISRECSEFSEPVVKDVIKDEAKETSKRKLTNEEAAVIIQSAYRGFDIRRWEPVKKLKQIAKVREQIDDVKNRVQELELSSDIQCNSNERIAIAETIMSLLLKLDAIQGLHPSVREVRKSVARELVSLQEKLDSLTNKKSEDSPPLESSVTHVEEALEENVEPRQHQLDGGSCVDDFKIPEEKPIGEQMNEKLEKEADELSQAEPSSEDSEPTITIEDEKKEKVNDDYEVPITNKMENHEVADIWQSSEPSVLLNNSSLQVKDLEPSHEEQLGETYNPEGTNRINELCPLAENNVEVDGKEKSIEENKVGDAGLCQDECSTHIFESCEASDERELLIEEAVNGKDATDCGVLDSDNSKMLGSALEKFPEKEINPSQLAEECYLVQEISPIDSSADIFEPAAAIGEKSEDGDIIARQDQNAADETGDHEEVLEGVESVKREARQVENEGAINTPRDIEVVSEPAQEYNSEHLLAEENLEEQKIETLIRNEGKAAVERDDLIESNGKLIEENERLRDMMEKLIESGQEQLNAISSLSGKVKDLERKLSRRKKLKTKQYGGRDRAWRHLTDL